MKIVFFGSPAFSIPTLELLHKSNHKILAVVTNKDKRSGRGLNIKSTEVKVFAEKHGYDVLMPTNMNDDNFINLLMKYNADIYIVVAYKKLPENIFNLPRFGAINLHASLLPNLRGAAPIQHAFLKNLKLTGVTTFQINKNIDSGLIFMQKEYKIDINDNYSTLYNNLSIIGADIVLKTINSLSKSKIEAKVQDTTKITYAPKISNSDRKIDWNDTSLNIINKIRAFSETPGAYTYINKKRFLIFKAKNCNKESNHEVAQIFYSKNKMLVSTKDGYIDLREVQIEGKKKMAAAEFIKGIQVENFTAFRI